MAAQHTTFKWFLLLFVLLGCLGTLAAALRVRTHIQVPRDIQSSYESPGFEDTLARINQQLAVSIEDRSLETAPPADWLTVCRRISLGLVGNGLALEEIRALERVPEADRVRWWTSCLLADRRWADYFSERLSRAYVGTNKGPFLLFRRRKFNNWLSEQLHGGASYDAIVRAMLTAEGLWTDTPAVNFATSTMDEAAKGRVDPIRLAGRTSRVFLAKRMDCLQCHNDFLDKQNFGSLVEPVAGTQRHFHELAAFFSGTAVKAFRGITEDHLPYRFAYLGESHETLVKPKVPFLPDLLPNVGKPREQLAAWVTHPENLAFARASVNRIWAVVVGRALVEPVDDIPLHDEVPPMLDTLARDFAAHGFDMRRLIRLIIQCDAFQRSSRADFAISESHEHSWAAFPLIQLRPEQVARSIAQACKLTALDERTSIFTQLKALGDSRDFLKQFGDRGEDEFDADAVTVAQRLILMNGNMVAERTKIDLIANASTRIARLVSDNSRAVELLYLAGLNRFPTAVERQRIEAYLVSRAVEPRAQNFGDIYWAMLNSTEFSWNH